MPKKGIKFNEEHKRKINESNKGKTISIESRKKMSNSKKKLKTKPPSRLGVRKQFKITSLNH